jgi:hypothetical protein
MDCHPGRSVLQRRRKPALSEVEGGLAIRVIAISQLAQKDCNDHPINQTNPPYLFGKFFREIRASAASASRQKHKPHALFRSIPKCFNVAERRGLHLELKRLRRGGLEELLDRLHNLRQRRTAEAAAQHFQP